MGYAVASDLDQILAKLPVASGVLRQGFLDAAEAEIHAATIGIYEVPIVVPSSVATTISGVTVGILKSIEQDLAAGRLLLALATSTENTEIHDYGKFLVDGAVAKLTDIKTQVLILPGATLDSDPNDDKPRPSQISYSSPDGKDVAVDTGSYFNRPYEQVANPDNETVGGPEL
jgi:hypothetical protein